MYLGPPCYGYALNCHIAYLAITGRRPYVPKSKLCLFYLYATAKSEIQICSNKHETCLVHVSQTLSVKSPYHLIMYMYLLMVSDNKGQKGIGVVIF